ncbi:SspB family protein [Swingsia samuiensis]|uniref:Stringent starvation protein B n=1 Tax=Swingsia samuiensis TaxID=1293412 RepID=A0A4Y6ULE4_9PROT|nr:ClpXP protease specificity-enhancing factor SspB [Swingsia samuiensis]QDH17177.1 hypothetical protein E3D00_06060 [Swingsia samuiensis]
MSNDDHNDQDGFDHELPESLLPYDQWIEDAYREVMLRAIEHVAEEGLPGDHHFYITFRTDRPDVIIPDRLRAQYPEEMTIVLQHQFWDLAVNRDKETVSVGLSFGGVGSILSIPISAITAFADPHMRLALRFLNVSANEMSEEEHSTEETTLEKSAEATESADDQNKKPADVVSLDAFRNRPKN